MKNKRTQEEAKRTTLKKYLEHCFGELPDFDAELKTALDETGLKKSDFAEFDFDIEI